MAQIPTEISFRGEVVTPGVTATSGLTSAGCRLTRLASDLGQARQKVRLYDPFMSGLQQAQAMRRKRGGWQQSQQQRQLLR